MPKVVQWHEYLSVDLVIEYEVDSHHQAAKRCEVIPADDFIFKEEEREEDKNHQCDYLL